MNVRSMRRVQATLSYYRQKFNLHLHLLGENDGILWVPRRITFAQFRSYALPKVQLVLTDQQQQMSAVEEMWAFYISWMNECEQTVSKQYGIMQTEQEVPDINPTEIHSQYDDNMYEYLEEYQIDDGDGNIEDKDQEVPLL
ncbi:unnamed protein product [Hermetia illucens]|uniref:Uncharacterized protein n=1 Tax=Hermetia illucens TaxID=343691 RepID=A0A7R8USV6_HERIL|nr:unnamed protein product [Hermetia illucens]